VNGNSAKWGYDVVFNGNPARVDYVADLVINKVKKLRDMSPLYEMHKEGIDLKTIQWEAH